MSRVDRYKHIHDHSETVEKKQAFNPRKEKKQKNIDNQATHSEEYYQSSPINPSMKQKKKKKKRKKKRRWLKRIIWLFLLLLGLMVFFFFKGKWTAENDPTLPKEQQEEFHGVKSSNGAKNILIIGSDTRGEDAGRADTIMVLQLGGPTKKPKLISFMRDILVDIPEVGENKINAAYAYGGAELVRETLKLNFNLDTKYYLKTDFQSFEKIVDSLFPKGVRIDAEKDLNLDGVDIQQGKQKMDGHTLLQYARFRMDEEGDFGRVRRQQQVMAAVISQLQNPATVVRGPESLGKLVGYLSTDIPTSFLLSNSPALLFSGGDVERLSVPVDNSWDYGESFDAGSVLEIDFQQNQTAIHHFLNQ